MKKIGNLVLIGYICFIFIQSLYFKFTMSPETIYIFVEKLDPWGFELTGLHLFNYMGIFSAYSVGAAELVASVLLLASLVPALQFLRVAGAGLALAVISGAIFFHLFTPLGIAVKNADGSFDGGELFAFAVGVWLASVILLVLNRALVEQYLRFFKIIK